MNDKKWVYLAGFIDADGCICISKDKRKNRKNIRYYCSVTVTNTNNKIMEWLKENITEIKYYIVNDKKSKYKNAKPVHIWKLTSHDNILFVLEKILPYLVIKKEQAINMIKFIKHRKYKKGQKYGHPYTEEDHERYFINKKLNKRGISNITVS